MGQDDTIITVKNPPIHYIFFTIPIVKYLLLKRQQIERLSFFICIIKKAEADKSASALLKLRFNLNTYIYILSFRKRCEIIIIRGIAHPS